MGIIQKNKELNKNEINEFYKKLYDEALNFKNEDLKNIVCTLLKENEQELKTESTKTSSHHNYVGGILEHSYEVLSIAKALTQVIDCNKELLYAGAIIHDIAKIHEDKIFAITHESLGALYVERVCLKLNIDEELKIALEHMLFSHHGRPEYGSTIKPMFLEAMLLHECDAISAKTKAYNDITDKLKEGTWSEPIKYLDNSRVYKFSKDFLKNKNPK